MQSPGPPYQGPSVVSTDLYSNRNYENHVLSSTGVSNNYLTYHTEGSHPSNYSEQNHYNSGSPTTHSPHIHYNSSNSGQNYGQPVSQYNEMYDTCSPYAANIPPVIRQPIPSSNIKYWNSDQMSHNSHNYNQGIPPPPLVSRNQSLGSPPMRSPHRNTGNNYSGTLVQHRSSSHSPQDWSRSPNVMSSPSHSTTPSPLSQHQSINRSPSHVSSVPTQQFSPTHTTHALSDASQQSVQKGQTLQTGFNNKNHNSSHGSASNPLQSLQKMVMTESDTDIRNTYNNNNNNNGSVDMNPNTIHKNYNNDQNVNNDHNNDPDSPYPTYYNLDQNRLCTPPHPSPNINSNDIPDDRKEVLNDRQLSENDIELKKCETNETKSSNSDSDLIYSNLDESKPQTVHQINNRTQNNKHDSTVDINGDIPLNKMNTPLPKSEVSSDLSQEIMTEHMTPPIVCKRTESRDSLQSSDSETAQSYGDSRAPHIWQMEKEYYNRYSDQKNNWSQQWPHNNLGQNSRPPPLPQNNYLASGNRGVVPQLNLPYQSQYRPTQCGSGSWAPSISSSQSSTPVQEFPPPNNMKTDSSKKKRGRPFGSKNRRNSDDNNETNPSDSGSSSKKSSKKIMTQEIGINTSVTIDSHGFDELTVVNPLKHSSKRKKTIGPFIRLEKTRGRDTTRYAIVNAPTKPEDEKDIKIKSLLTKTEPIKHIRRPSLLATAKKGVSLFSPQYDLSTTDKTWICALCHKGPHYKGLGDLFGPYFISIDDKNKSQTSSSTNNTSGQTSSTARTQSSLFDSYDKTIDSVIASELKTNEKRSRKKKSETTEEQQTFKGRHKQSPKSVVLTQNCETEATVSNSSNSEVWVHEDCIVWSNGVYLIGHRVKNLEEIITESNENICTKCKLSGATLGCLQKSCNTSQFHYLCAKEKGCEMDEENFSLYCPKHKKKTKCNSEDSSIGSLAKS